MPANYLHGVETIEASSGTRPVRVVKSAVIGIIGTDPVAVTNSPILILSKKDAAEKLGPALSQFTLRKHVDKILEQGAATIIAINVFNQGEHFDEVQGEKYVVQDGTVQITNQIISTESVSVQDEDENTTFQKGVDYAVNAYGTIKVLNHTLIPDLSTVSVSYSFHELDMVSNGDIIGEMNEDRELSGLQAFALSFTMYGFSPKIFIAPVFCETNDIATALISTANQFRGRALIDAPAHTTVAGCVTGRGPLGEINFNTSSKRAVLCFPAFGVPAPWLEPFGAVDYENFGLSTLLAGVWTKTINNEGYWVSPSNKEMAGVLKPEVIVTSAINDASTDANFLNENGIVTYFTSFGTGYRTWGNRSAAWPTDTAVDNFLPVLMTADVIDESIELAMLPFIDKPLTNATIDAIKETVNGFLNSLVQRGAILPGAECIYDPAENPISELALGHITFLDKYLPPTPAERITFKRYLATELLANLGQ